MLTPPLVCLDAIQCLSGVGFRVLFGTPRSRLGHLGGLDVANLTGLDTETWRRCARLELV